MIDIRLSTYEEAKTLLGPWAKRVGVNPLANFIGAYDGEKIVGCVAFRYWRGGRIIELGSAIVLPEYRKRGIYTKLYAIRKQVISKYPHSKEIAYCTDYSLPLLLKDGFKITRKYKTSTKVEKTYGLSENLA